MDLEGKPHIVDFGLAKTESQDFTMTLAGQFIGTPAYTIAGTSTWRGIMDWAIDENTMLYFDMFKATDSTFHYPVTDVVPGRIVGAGWVD